MNRFPYILALMLCLVIASCDDEKPGTDEPGNGGGSEIETSFWEHTHAALAGLKGAVDRVTETTYALEGGAEIEPVVQLDMSFDAGGRMTFYNATGMEPEVPETRGVWQTLAYYAYRYDENGRMIQATVTPVGDVPVVYHLTYAEHTQYVPLIFPLGSMEFFPVKGLKSIVSEDGTVSYSFDGVKASYKQEMWTGDVEMVYSYTEDSPYPSQKAVTTSRGAEILSMETTVYTYGEQGRLAKTDVRVLEGEEETLRTITNYVGEQSLLPLSVRMDAGGFRMDWDYTYTDEFALQRVEYTENRGSEEEVTDREVYEYTSVDGNGNWTDSKQWQSGRVDMAHQDGLVGVRRAVTYR